MHRIINHFTQVTILLCMLNMASAHAVQHSERFWTGFNAQTTLDIQKKWLGSFFSQARFIKEQTHPFELVFAETCLGYQLQEDNSLWLGYRLTKHFNNKPIFYENRGIQQWIANYKGHFAQFTFRSRLEERYRSNRKQLALFLRERISLEFPFEIGCRINPFLYNELFFMLNKTTYTPRKFIGQNRLFVGFNFYTQKTAWWEIGYLMQYQTNTPRNRHYHLNHILSINYNYR